MSPVCTAVSGTFDTCSAIAVPTLLSVSLFYNGPGHSLHWLALCGLLLLLWLATSIARLDVSHTSFLQGWLPKLALTYVVWVFVNPFASTYPYASSTTAMQLALLPLAFIGWLILPSLNRDKAWRGVWALLLLISVVLAGWGFVDFFVPPSRGAHGPLIDSNAYAALINLFLIPATFLFLRADPAAKGIESPRLLLALIATLALAVSVSLSRGGLLSLLVMLPLVLWLNRRFPAFRWRAVLLLFVLMLAYLLTKTVPLGVNKRVETLLLAPAQQVEKDDSIQARLLIWKATWKIFEQSNPLIGTGLGTYKNYYATYRDTKETMSSGNLAHNDYLQALQEGGLIQLTFLLALVVLAPVSLLHRMLRNAKRRGYPGIADNTAGLLLGIVAVSLHALVNFIHYVAPVAFLTGLYLARSWETREKHNEGYPSLFGSAGVKPAFLKALAIVLLAIPFTVLAMDGITFKFFATNTPLIARLAPHDRFTVVNIALAIRPGNPRPRIFLLQYLLNSASTAESAELREQLLAQAEIEAKAVIRTAPALASGSYFLGRVRTLRATPGDLLLARSDLERAVNLIPASAGIRLELVKLYQNLGLEQEAYGTIREAKKWYLHEPDYASLAAFAKVAQSVALHQQDRDEAEFWAWVYDRLVRSLSAG